jgi:hypothetical protein
MSQANKCEKHDHYWVEDENGQQVCHECHITHAELVDEVIELTNKIYRSTVRQAKIKPRGRFKHWAV